MKKDLKKLLSAQAQNILPDERVKENIKSELGCSDGERAYAHGGTESKGKKNILVISVAVLMALTLCLCILLPVFLKGTGTPGEAGNSIRSKLRKIFTRTAPRPSARCFRRRRKRGRCALTDRAMRKWKLSGVIWRWWKGCWATEISNTARARHPTANTHIR